MIFGLIFAIIAFGADQFSKWYIEELFAQNPGMKVFGDYFNVVEAWNPGVSFSMFDNNGFIGTVILILFALSVVAFLLHWLYHEQNKWIQAALGMVIGGALGNVVDRIRFGAVYDFLDFHYDTLHWPAFNLADSFICLGAFLIIVESFLNRHKNH